jgi:transcription elongation GreA/GreB family factor
MWSDKLAALEKEYVSVMEQRGEAAQMGDLRENAAYAMLTEQGEVLSARISDMKKMIKDLEGNTEDSASPRP